MNYSAYDPIQPHVKEKMKTGVYITPSEKKEWRLKCIEERLEHYPESAVSEEMAGLELWDEFTAARAKLNDDNILLGGELQGGDFSIAVNTYCKLWQKIIDKHESEKPKPALTDADKEWIRQEIAKGGLTV